MTPSPPQTRQSPPPAQAGERAQLRIQDGALAPGLYVVSTPIGNLRDITLRALDVLAAADLVLAEDTRTSRVLFDAYGLKPKVRPYHEHNAAAVRPQILAMLEGGATVALMSDAGTPLVSDPGFKLVRAAVEAGVPVIPTPGASAVLAALVAAGLPTDRFLFAGFPPPRSGARRAMLEELASAPATLVFFEAGSRLSAALTDMAAVLGDRPAAVLRELTKTFEERRGASLADLAHAVAADGPPKGELVIVVGPPGASRWDDARVDDALRERLAASSLKDAAAAVATASGWAKRDVYARAVALRRDEGQGVGEANDVRGDRAGERRAEPHGRSSDGG